MYARNHSLRQYIPFSPSPHEFNRSTTPTITTITLPIAALVFIQGCRQGCGHPSRCSPQEHSPKIMYANTTNHPSVRCKLPYLCTCQYPGLRTGLRVFRRSLSRSGMTVNITRLHALMAKVHPSMPSSGDVTTKYHILFKLPTSHLHLNLAAAE